MVRVVMIDDEILAITLLENLIKGINGVIVVGKFTSFDDVDVSELKELQPDLILLDIEMPRHNGIQVAEQINRIDDNIDVVFVTAYDQYALEAFDVEAVDYLLKPVTKERLKKTIDKLVKRRGKKPLSILNKKNELKAQFFGHFVLYDKENQPIKWRTKKVKELCAYLLHHQDEHVHKEQILEDLWPSIPIEKSKNLLHTSIYQLRQVFKNQGFEDTIQYMDERYKLNLAIISDKQDLTSVIDTTNITEDQMKNLLALYKDEYLAQDDYLWSSGKRHTLRIKLLRMLESYYHRSQHSLDGELLHPILIRLIELEPYEEYYRQLLLKSLLVQGNIGEALKCYSEYEDLLWIEMNETPKKETEEILKKYL